METNTERITPHVKRSEDTNTLMEECGVFWAFSREQFTEGKARINLQEGEKLVDIGAGGFMPMRNKQKYIAGMKAIYNVFKEAMKDEKARRAHILYELNNHEAYYTRSIESTLDALGDDFTREEVVALFKNKNATI